MVDITSKSYQPGDHLIEKIRDGSLFSQSDNGLNRHGGIKGYPSSINYVAAPRLRLQKSDAEKLIDEIDLPPLEGWIQGFVWDILDGDTFDLYLETNKSATISTRLFGADAPEYNESSPDFVLGLEAKTFVEDLFKNSRYCYAKDFGIDAYKRNLMQVMNSDGENIGIELLRNGLAVPMMGYFDDADIRNEYVAVTSYAYENKRGIWAIQEVSDRYNNILSDTNKTEFSLLGHIPVKSSAIDRYLRQNPKAKIVYAALNRKKVSDKSRKTAEEIFELIMSNVNPDVYDIDAFKEMCSTYLEEIGKLDEASHNPEVVKDCIMHIEDLLDELNLGDGPIKGNFSKGVKKLIFHDDPETRWYQLCIPEIMFRTVEDAKYCHFKKGPKKSSS